MSHVILVLFVHTAVVTLPYLWMVLLLTSVCVNLPSGKVVGMSILSWHLWLWSPEMLFWLLASVQFITVLDSWEVAGIRRPCGGCWGQGGRHQQRQRGHLQKNQDPRLRSPQGHLWLVPPRTLDLLGLQFYSEGRFEKECDTIESPWCCGSHTATWPDEGYHGHAPCFSSDGPFILLLTDARYGLPSFLSSVWFFWAGHLE